MARRVHGERSVGLLYGQRALLIGALEPLTYTGTMLSTRAGDRPFKRLARTAKIQETIFLGTRAEADKALAGGPPPARDGSRATLPEAAGVHPAGTAYSAFDPELMLWTLAVIADSGRAMYETMVRPLSDAEREDLWQDYVRFGELFGLPRERGPGQPTASSAPGSTASSPHPTCTRPSTRWRWRRWSPSSSRCRCRPAATSPSRTTSSRGRCRRGCGRSSASAGARAHEAAFRAIDRRPPPRPPRSSRAGCAAAATTYFFDVVTRVEQQRGGTRTPELHAGAS